MAVMILRRSARSLTPQTYFLSAMLAISAAMVSTSGQAASCTIPKSYYKYVSCTNDSRYFLAIRDSGTPVALINKAGKKVVDLSRYQKVAADKISGGLMPVQRQNKVGYLNMQGRETVPAIYDILLNEAGTKGWARPVSDGRIVVKKNDNYGVITTGNKVIIPFSSDIISIADFKDGRAQVNKRSKGMQWLDKQGNISRSAPANEPSQVASKTSKTKSGSSAKSTAATSAAQSTSAFTTLYPHQQDGRWGFVDDKKVTMITYSFEEVMPFSEGLAGVRIANNWGFVNLGGELVIPFRFDDAGVDKDGRYEGVKPFTFKNGKAWVGSLKNGNKICIDTQGTNVSC